MYHLSIHVGRVLTTHIPFFKTSFGDVTVQHIPHLYKKEMSMKSDIIPLGVLLKNESDHDDLISILEYLHKYVPGIPDDAESSSNDQPYHGILLGGDQLSTSMTRRVKAERGNSTTIKNRLEGLEPVCEDWHTKLCLVMAIWKCLYKQDSSSEKGTLYQLRNLINRRDVTSTPKNCFDACEDFLDTVVDAHVVAATLESMKMSSINDTPPSSVISEDVWLLSSDERRDLLHKKSQSIVKSFVFLDPTSTTTKQSDGVFSYGCLLLSLGLLYREFVDSIREGDGNRVLRCWKYFLLIFNATGRTNYAIEAFVLLAKYHFLLSPRKSNQLIWSRFINVHGLPGKNIPADLFMEHLNRLCKEAIKQLGANKTQRGIQRVIAR